MDRSDRVGLWVLAAALVAVPGWTQTTGSFTPIGALDLSGNWAPLFQEDQPERIPGPELVNYAGLPITEGARLWAESWDASRLTLPERSMSRLPMTVIRIPEGWSRSSLVGDARRPPQPAEYGVTG